MAKNIIIFSDGTGQRSGISFDERRSNIYKLFRATRCGPDTTIDPGEQLTFYDGGVGTAPPGSGALKRTYVRIRNVVGMATGWGLTTNVVDCYAAIIRLWRPGDKIYLFGFSRGAYTVRLLGGVLSHCGIPTAYGDKPLPRDAKTIRKIAKEGVTKVYQHTGSVRLEDYRAQLLEKFGRPDEPLPDKAERLYQRKKERLDQRSILAADFRDRYKSDMRVQSEKKKKVFEVIPDRGKSNVVPYFIGVFDTVSSMWHRRAVFALLGVFVAALLALSLLISATTNFLWPLLAVSIGTEVSSTGFWTTFFSSSKWLIGLTFLPGLAYFLYCHIRCPGALAGGIGGRTYTPWETMTFFTRMVFDDRTLSSRVPYARHAIAVDEMRDLFALVRWEHEDTPHAEPKKALEDDPHHSQRMLEMCFAGAHTDIGGGYPEDESRLSDIALNWMAKEAKAVGLQIDRWYFQLWPDALGIQHDESGNFPHNCYEASPRAGLDDVELHPSLEHRVRAPSVLFRDREDKYRPAALDNNPTYREWLGIAQDPQSAPATPAPPNNGAGRESAALREARLRDREKAS